jgi:hypothetical protein
MTLEQPLDKRLFGSRCDDVEILAKLVTRGDDWEPTGFALHVQTARSWEPDTRGSSRACRGPALLRGLLAGLEHVATWPMTVLVDRYHPPQRAAKARRQRPSLRPGGDPPRSVRGRPRFLEAAFNDRGG